MFLFKSGTAVIVFCFYPLMILASQTVTITCNYGSKVVTLHPRDGNFLGMVVEDGAIFDDDDFNRKAKEVNIGDGKMLFDFVSGVYSNNFVLPPETISNCKILEKYAEYFNLRDKDLVSFWSSVLMMFGEYLNEYPNPNISNDYTEEVPENSVQEQETLNNPEKLRKLSATSLILSFYNHTILPNLSKLDDGNPLRRANACVLRALICLAGWNSIPACLDIFTRDSSDSTDEAPFLPISPCVGVHREHEIHFKMKDLASIIKKGMGDIFWAFIKSQAYVVGIKLSSRMSWL